MKPCDCLGGIFKKEIKKASAKVNCLECSHCYKTGTLKDVQFMRCSKCKVTTYCSRECQVANWKIHKIHCKYLQGQELTEEEKDKLGQYLASRHNEIMRDKA